MGAIHDSVGGPGIRNGLHGAGKCPFTETNTILQAGFPRQLVEAYGPGFTRAGVGWRQALFHQKIDSNFQDVTVQGTVVSYGCHKRTELDEQ